MKILPSFDIEMVKLVLEKDFPELNIGKIILNNRGVDNVIADVDNRYIFRFPRDNGVRQETEIKVLKYLRNKISLPIPNLEFFGKEYSYFGYRKIIGDPLNEEKYHQMSEGKKDELALELASFFKEMHSSTTPAEAKQMGVNQELLEWYLNNVKENKERFSDQNTLAFIDENVEKFLRILTSSDGSVLLYNDLHENNVAYDYSAKKLNGLFDFGDVQIGNFNLDFAPIYRFAGNDLVKRIVSHYEKLTGRQVNWDFVKTYAYVWKISDIAEYSKSKIISDKEIA